MSESENKKRKSSEEDPMATKTKEMSLKLVVDVGLKKVIYTEAKKDFIDFLFGLLCYMEIIPRGFARMGEADEPGRTINLGVIEEKISPVEKMVKLGIRILGENPSNLRMTIGGDDDLARPEDMDNADRRDDSAKDDSKERAIRGARDQLKSHEEGSGTMSFSESDAGERSEQALGSAKKPLEEQHV